MSTIKISIFRYEGKRTFEVHFPDSEVVYKDCTKMMNDIANLSLRDGKNVEIDFVDCEFCFEDLVEEKKVTKDCAICGFEVENPSDYEDCCDDCHEKTTEALERNL